MPTIRRSRFRVSRRGRGASVYPDPSLDLTVPGGTDEIALVLRDLEGRGGVGFPYRIIVTPIVPTFVVNSSEPQVNIPKGGRLPWE